MLAARLSATKFVTSVSAAWAGFASLLPMLTGRLRATPPGHAGARTGASSSRSRARPAMRWLEKRRPFDPAYAALGVLNPEARVETFYRAVEGLVLPRLTRLGIDGALAWKNRYRHAVSE